MTGRALRRFGLGAIAIVLGGLGLGADAPTQTIDAGGLTFQVPTSWKSIPPSSSMRRAELRVAPAEGDKEPPKIDTKMIKGKNVDVTRVETAGHYFPMTFPGQPKQVDRPHYRLLGAIVQAGETGYYLKMVGPDKTMQAARPDFDQLIASVGVEKP
jgi:hypothetical protein